MKSRCHSRVSRPSLPDRAAAAVDSLPELDRLVLSLRLLEGLSALETAGALRLTAREIERRTASALRMLAAELAARRPSKRAA